MKKYFITSEYKKKNLKHAENQFKNDNNVTFTESSKIQFIKFQQENNQLFIDIIIKINDSK